MRDGTVSARCEDLARTYWTETEQVEALRGVTASFRSAAVTAVMGPSGSGKSSLLRILAGLDRPTSGRVEVGGRDITHMSKRSLRKLRRGAIGYVFQRPTDNFVSYLTVAEHLEMASRAGRQGGADPAGLLTLLGLEHRRDHYPHELSGGEQQRAAFAQVLVAHPTLVVADEPTAELDSTTGADVLRAVRDLAELGVGFVLATHDRQVADIADDILELHEGVLVGVSLDESQWMRPS